MYRHLKKFRKTIHKQNEKFNKEIETIKKQRNPRAKNREESAT